MTEKLKDGEVARLRDGRMNDKKETDETEAQRWRKIKERSDEVRSMLQK